MDHQIPQMRKRNIFLFTKKTLDITWEYPEINDGIRGMLFIEKVINSHKQGNKWVKL